ncbi:hypothetical protein C8K30_11830 [Promicromonospora sp. AC04]|uniref:hypothetical protein n=1 Tax=Promicromonospora sp. AC04 TaxID=2135723 RepID=UPI000D370D0C|nr:hypothetical protein [Promicromonospora sp. AC04]PUB20147.1 hypothetical protein C8K30_11830 [Promicromonospora sp. AC04]
MQHPRPAPRTTDPRATSQRVAGALVESPLQLLCTVEAHAAGFGGTDTHVHVRDDVPALGDALSAVRELTLPEGLTFDLAGRRSALTAREPVWLVGDAFSGLFQATAPLRRPDRIVLVDDGLATLELCRLLVRRDPLVRIGSTVRAPRRRLGAVAAGRLRSLAADGRVTIFTALPLGPDLTTGLRAQGFDVRHNRFGWLTAQPADAALPEPTVVVGSAMAADGLIDADRYVDWIRSLAKESALRYLPHRRQTPELLAALAEIDGVTVDAPGAPVEIRLRGLRAGQRVVSLPSTSTILLTTIISPLGVPVTALDVPADWWTPRASADHRAHLTSVVELARQARAAAEDANETDSPEANE